MYCGTITTWIGSMMLSSMIANQNFFPTNSSRANAYAAIEHDTRLPRTLPSTTAAEFSR